MCTIVIVVARLVADKAWDAWFDIYIYFWLICNV